MMNQIKEEIVNLVSQYGASKGLVVKAVFSTSDNDNKIEIELSEYKPLDFKDVPKTTLRKYPK